MRLGMVVVLMCLSGTTAIAQTTNGWVLAWSDEFNEAANTPPDPSKWNYDLGDGGWGNGEQETYTDSPNNVFQDGNGHLVIRAIRDASGNYTSARIRTGATGAGDAVNLDFQYGKIEARIKLPYGQGVWPAFWMLGGNIETVSWPQCGEIDILENFGSNIDNASTIHGTLHGPPAGSDYAGTGLTAAYQLPFEEKLTDDYHVFSVEWAENAVNFVVDGTTYQQLTPASVPVDGQWVFNQSFFIILNLAIGGPTTFLGEPSASAPFPQEMLVDYVRVYQATTLTAVTPNITPGGVVNAASGLGTIAAGGLVSLYGVNLADGTYTSTTPSGSGLFANGAFATETSSGVSVSVNGVNAPLVYVSPTQINLQLPWEAATAPAQVDVTVKRAGVTSATESVTVTPAAPAVFLDPNNQVALLTNYSGGSLTAGDECVLYGNGFGGKTATLEDGVPAGAALATGSTCALTISGVTATVQYCGTAPGEVIDQLNFLYPAGVAASTEPVIASLTIDGVSGVFLMPAPAQ